MLILGTNSYVSQEEAAEYIADQGLSALSDAESLLKRATTAIDRLYGNRWLGQKLEYTQALHWPRNESGAVDSDGNYRDLSGVPAELKQAVIELAVLMDAGTDPYVQPDPTVKSESFEIDVLKETKSYSTNHRADPLFTITLILRPILARAGSLKFVR